MQNISLTDTLEMLAIEKGEHLVHMQFQDVTGWWSSAITDTVDKAAFPVAGFSYTSLPSCDSTVVSYVNESVDADSVYWEFGNGITSHDIHPGSTFKGPGSYNVTLHVVDEMPGSRSQYHLKFQKR